MQNPEITLSVALQRKTIDNPGFETEGRQTEEISLVTTMGVSESKESNLNVRFWYEGRTDERPGDRWMQGLVQPYNVEMLKETAEKQDITHLVIEGEIPADIDKLVPKLTHLRITYLPDQDVPKLASIGKLKDLRDLQLTFSSITELPLSIMELNNLTSLSLANNKVSQLPESIGELRSLKTLNLRYNNFTQLPSSIGKLCNLERLYVERNKVTHLPESIGELKSLAVLHLKGNNLTQLPVSIGKLSNLQSMNLRENRTLSHLPESIGELRSLRKLWIDRNNLTELPESIGRLSNLVKLILDNNKLTRLPESIGELSNLKKLNLKGNGELTKIPESIVHLNKLTELEVRGCYVLHTPPLQVCKQGLSAIKQYFKDLEKGRGKSLPAATIAVIGEKMAGKTSLIRTLQNKENKRVLTVRRPETGRDDATRVFNVEEVPTEDMILRFVDVGGHEVYHVTYPLTLRDSCIPVIVINLMSYYNLSVDKDVGPIEAVRWLCFDSLSQLYISNPDLGSPILILSHKDCFDNESHCEKSRLEFLEKCELLRQRIVNEYRQSKTRLAGHIGNSDSPLFQESEIFSIGGESDDYEVFQHIIQALRLRCKKFVKVVPSIWEVIAKVLSAANQPFVMFNDLLKGLSKHYTVDETQLVVVLTYLHECGKILWYPNVEELKPYIFHRIPEVTTLLCVLFAHDDEARWKVRLADDRTFIRSDGSIVEHEEYQAMYQKFSTSGVMDEDLLVHLITSESSFSAEWNIDPAILLLSEFRLLYGPTLIKGRECFLSPYFAVGYQSNNIPSLSQKPLRIRSVIRCKGLAIPRYFYGKMCVETLNQFSEDLTNDVALAKNGVTINQGDLSIMYTHDSKSRKIVFEVGAEADEIVEGWDVMLKLIADFDNHVKAAWPATRYVVESTCPHCLLVGHQHPKKEINPPWLTEKSNKRKPMKSMVCQQASKIPACLILPCMELTETESERLQSYVDENWVKDDIDDTESVPEDSSSCETGITTHEVLNQTADQTMGSAVSHVYACEDDDSDLSDGEDLLSPKEEFDNEIRIKSQHTWKKRIKSFFYNTDKVYEMSKTTRGRAMIINIERFNGPDALDLTRDGSSMDVKNLKFMLAQFGFELAPVKENLDAQEILTAIKEETRHENHGDYNLFFLCIMTHGKEDDQILGSDQRTVKLKDIYELLSPASFPAMAGKPKIVVIQACAGSKKDLGQTGSQCASQDTAEPQPELPNPYSADSSGPSVNDIRNIIPDECVTNSPKEAGGINHLDVEDLLIIKSSFENYMSIRNVKSGSLFIRSLVVTLHRHACHRDLYSLCEIVQHRVRTESKRLANKYPDYCFGQTVIAIKTFTRLRKVYLFPGYDPRSD